MKKFLKTYRSNRMARSPREIKQSIRKKLLLGLELDAVERHYKRTLLYCPKEASFASRLRLGFRIALPLGLSLATIVLLLWPPVHAFFNDDTDPEYFSDSFASHALELHELTQSEFALVRAVVQAHNEDVLLIGEQEVLTTRVAHVPVKSALLEQALFDVTKRQQQSLPSAAELKNKDLIKFIAGIINVYHPEVKNGDAVAQHIVEISHANKIDPLYVASIVSVESSFLTHARSSAGAVGLMQLMPATATEVARKKLAMKMRPALTDPRTNISLGIHYIRDLEQKYKGNKINALRAYNWGPGNVDKARSGQRRVPSSVKRYADKVLARTTRWNRVFKTATENAEGLERSIALAMGGSQNT